MLVMLAPSFDCSAAGYAQLSELTGTVTYDLKSRVKPGAWGLLRVLGDAAEAQELCERLRAAGFAVVVVNQEVSHDPERRMVHVQGLVLEDDRLVIHLRERSMSVPYAALTCIVRGEVQTGRQAGRPPVPGGSSATFRAVVPSAAELQVFREALPAGFDAFAAADLHFWTVTWVARIDARNFEFESVGMQGQSPAAALDALVEKLAERAKVRIDREVRSSSVATFVQQAGARHPAGHAAPEKRPVPTDERFDPYSRLIAEAERQLARYQGELVTADGPGEAPS